MVKSIVSILLSALLIAGIALFEWFYLEEEFTSFETEITILCQKAEEETANVEDAKAVRASWEGKKKNLHTVIPHNDIARIDEYLSEAIGLIDEKNYALALAKLEILSQMCKNLPDVYRPALENIL